MGEPTCSLIGASVKVVLNPGSGLSVNVGDFVSLSGSGYLGCWEVLSTTTGPSATNIIAVHVDCDCL